MMMYRMLYLALPFCMLAGLVSGCAQMKQQAEADRAMAETVEDTQTLVDFLGERNIGLISHGRFSVQEITTPGYEFTVTSGGSLFILEYPTGGDALVDVAWLERERNLSDERHLYRKENLVAVYYGDDPRVARALRMSMGSGID